MDVLVEGAGEEPETMTGRAWLQAPEVDGNVVFTVAEVGGFSGPLMLGIIRDATGSLEAGVITLAIVTGLLMTSTLLIREPRG